MVELKSKIKNISQHNFIDMMKEEVQDRTHSFYPSKSKYIESPLCNYFSVRQSMPH
jgi:hypothetical protein